MKYEFRSRSFPYGHRQPYSYAIILSDILAAVGLVVLLAVMIGITSILV